MITRIPALSIRQPWAWCIVNGFKPVENREWHTRFQGRILVHAGKAMTKIYYREVRDSLLGDGLLQHLPAMDELERGGIVGATTIVDCVTQYSSPWFTGPYGFVCKNPKPLPFLPLIGKLGFFDVDGLPAGYLDQLPQLATPRHDYPACGVFRNGRCTCDALDPEATHG